MTKARQKAKVKSKKVWRIFRFRQRYELDDDVRFERKRPLIYTKDFVGSGNDDESCGWWRQLIALRTKSNWLALRGAFAELKNIAGNMSQVYRGYLLNSNFEPASETEIGRWLGLMAKQAGDILKELSDIGLIEQVTMPDFSLEDSEKARKESKKSGKSRARTRKKTKSRSKTKKSEKSRDALNKKTKYKNKYNAQTNVCANSGNGKPLRAKDNRQGILQHPSARKSKTNSKTNSLSTTAQSPATTPPIMPQASDAERSNVIQFAKASPGSVNHNRSEPKKIGDVIAKMRHRYDIDAQQFAIDIYKAFGEPWPLGSPDANREIGCFASCYEKTAVLPVTSRNELCLSLVKEAFRLQKVYRKKGGYFSAVKVWCKRIFPEKLFARQKRCKVM